MTREQNFTTAAGLMVAGAALLLVYAIVFLIRAFTGAGFELGVDTLNGVTTQQLDGVNPAIMGYITHLHAAIAGFLAATAIAVAGLAWWGVRFGAWWAWVLALIVPVVALVIALPMHYTGSFEMDWISHLGPIYVALIIYAAGLVVALFEFNQTAHRAVPVGR